MKRKNKKYIVHILKIEKFVQNSIKSTIIEIRIFESIKQTQQFLSDFSKEYESFHNDIDIAVIRNVSNRTSSYEYRATYKGNKIKVNNYEKC